MNQPPEIWSLKPGPEFRNPNPETCQARDEALCPHEVIKAEIIKLTFRDLFWNGDVTAFSAGT
jgi:hypothetical protein